SKSTTGSLVSFAIGHSLGFIITFAPVSAELERNKVVVFELRELPARSSTPCCASEESPEICSRWNEMCRRPSLVDHLCQLPIGQRRNSKTASHLRAHLRLRSQSKS